MSRWNEIADQAKDALKIAQHGGVAEPRPGLKGQILGPTFRPNEQPTDSADVTIETNHSETTTTFTKRRG
jgi:hypothetical protein